MDEIHHVLHQIGLSSSEQKVYLALLQLGTSPKGKIVKTAGIAPSKLYEVADRLIAKGLVSVVMRNNVKQFFAAPLSRVQSYLQEKKDEISQVQDSFDHILPQLQKLQSQATREQSVQVYYGWKGLQTVYHHMLNTLQKGEIDYVLGASSGIDKKRTSQFFGKHMQAFYNKGIPIHAIFNEKDRTYFESIPAERTHIVSRYLPNTAPSEINMYRDTTVIVTLTHQPIAIVITSEITTRSFKEYFDQMWKIAQS